MKKLIVFSIFTFVSIVFFSCSKKDTGAPNNTTTTVTISNQSKYDFSATYLLAYTVTDINSISSDTAKKSFNLGALKIGSSAQPFQLDKKFKSIAIVFSYTNPILGNNTYNALVLKLGDGTSMTPYPINTGQKTTITLDQNMSIKLVQ